MSSLGNTVPIWRHGGFTVYDVMSYPVILYRSVAVMHWAWRHAGLTDRLLHLQQDSQWARILSLLGCCPLHCIDNKYNIKDNFGFRFREKRTSP